MYLIEDFDTVDGHLQLKREATTLAQQWKQKAPEQGLLQWNYGVGSEYVLNFKDAEQFKQLTEFDPPFTAIMSLTKQLRDKFYIEKRQLDQPQSSNNTWQVMTEWPCSPARAPVFADSVALCLLFVCFAFFLQVISPSGL